MICKRYFVAGRVQGVYYRASTARVATSLGIAGHARNLDDGRVEVLALAAAPEDHAQLLAWLWQGPSAAKVTAVTVEDVDATAVAVGDGFTTG